MALNGGNGEAGLAQKEGHYTTTPVETAAEKLSDPEGGNSFKAADAVSKETAHRVGEGNNAALHCGIHTNQSQPSCVH